jgi:N-acylneuraminate cytidylyltransferase
VSSIDEIVVSSDSDAMLNMADKEGVKTHKRAIEYADEKTKSFSEVVNHIAQNATQREHILWSPCVCPLVSASLYDAAIKKYREVVNSPNSWHDSLISVRLFKEYLWDENAPINYTAGRGHVPSQQLPDWYIVINGFHIARRMDMIKWSYLFGNKPYKMIVDKKYAIDIDDKEDFAIARALLQTVE